MLKIYAIPALGGLALSTISGCSELTAPVPECEPANDSVWDTGSYNSETGETIDGLYCPDFEASCCPDSSPSAGADPLAGSWEVEGYGVGGFDGCGSPLFPAGSKRAEPQTCLGYSSGCLQLGDDLQGCLGLSRGCSISSYAPYMGSPCRRYGFSVAGTRLGQGQYIIKLLTTERSLDLSCSLDGDNLDCTDEYDNPWRFERP